MLSPSPHASFSSSPLPSPVSTAWPRPGQSAGWVFINGRPCLITSATRSWRWPTTASGPASFSRQLRVPRLRLQDPLLLPGDWVHPAWAIGGSKPRVSVCCRADSQPSRGWGSWLEPHSTPCHPVAVGSKSTCYLWAVQWKKAPRTELLQYLNFSEMGVTGGQISQKANESFLCGPYSCPEPHYHPKWGSSFSLACTSRAGGS